jgi:hypothetical protein
MEQLNGMIENYKKWLPIINHKLDIYVQIIIVMVIGVFMGVKNIFYKYLTHKKKNYFK